MRKALHVIRSLQRCNGGTSAAVPELARATHNYQSEIVAFDGNEPIDNAYSFPTQRTQLPWQPLRLYSEALQRGSLSRLIETSDLVHVHGLWQAHCAASCLVSRRQRKPLMISAHGMLQPWALANKRWKKNLYAALLERPNLNRASCLCALTKTEAQDYRKFGLKNPIALIPNGVQRPPDCNSSAILNEFPALLDKRIILFLGRIHYKKGVDTLCDAWSRIANRYPETILVMAGPDFESTQKAIEKRFADLGTRHRVHFTGMLNDNLKWSALSASYCFILPSYSEGFSVAVLEALASSLPVIITKQCNFPEVADSRCGWVIEPTADELEAALVSCLEQSPTERALFSANGVKLVVDRYSWARVGAMLTETYDWMLGGPLPSLAEIIAN